MSLPTIAQCLARANELQSLSDSPRLDVELLLVDILQKSRTFLFTWPEQPLTSTQAETFNEYFGRRKKGEPIAHILGYREFWSLPLAVNASTLIPRPDTEVLVEQVLAAFSGDRTAKTRKLLDLGTGSGAIALAIASEKPHWNITAVDYSSAAVNLAISNRDRLNLSNVQVIESHWFSALAGKVFDVIVSNPPYIDPKDPHLTTGDVRFEPLTALVAEQSGLADLIAITQESTHHLEAGGWLFLEHGYDQGAIMRELLRDHGYVAIQTFYDYGGNERVTCGRRG